VNLKLDEANFNELDHDSQRQKGVPFCHVALIRIQSKQPMTKGVIRQMPVQHKG